MRFLALTLAFLAASGARAGVLASSAADFSDVQGRRSWFYGYAVERPGLAYDADLDFKLLPTFANQVWRGVAPHLEVGGIGLHPNGANSPGGSVWAIRRWVSTYTGPARISGLAGYSGGSHLPNQPFVVEIRIASQLVFHRAVPFNSAPATPYAVDVALVTGQPIDFVARSLGNDATNWARLTGDIVAVPEPSSLGALAVAGITLAALRRASGWGARPGRGSRRAAGRLPVR